MGFDDAGSSQLSVMPGPAQPQPRTARPLKSSLLDSAYKHVASFVQTVRERLYPSPLRDWAAVTLRHPGLHSLATQTDRVAHIGDKAAKPC